MKNKFNENVTQGDLFSNLSSTSIFSLNEPVGETLPLQDAEVTFYEFFFNKQESDEFFQSLYDHIQWRQDKMNIFGKDVNLPRKTAWYGDSDRSYTFSGIHLDPLPWTPALLQIKGRIEKVAEVEFNSVLLNLYRDGNDGISWHTDAEPELGENPAIGSVSFGETRKFQFRHRFNKTLEIEKIELTHGSFLLMAGASQHFWQHQVPKTKMKVQPRINLTFRVIIS